MIDLNQECVAKLIDLDDVVYSDKKKNLTLYTRVQNTNVGYVRGQYLVFPVQILKKIIA